MFNTRECSIDNVIQLIQCHPFVMAPQCERSSTSGSVHIILFTEVRHSSSDETRWNSPVVVEHLHTFNITVEAASIIEMDN